MAIVLPFFALFVLVLVFRKASGRWRQSCLDAALVFGLFIWLSTELLSLFALIRFAALVLLWALFCLTVMVVWFRLPPAAAAPVVPLPRRQRVAVWVSVGGIALLLLLVLIPALWAPPNMSDTLTYHMPRVVRWIQNRHVGHYLTHIDRQLWTQPFAGFVILHFQILSGGDHFANLPQWLSLVGCAVAASLIAESLGSRRLGQCLAGIFCVTLPMGILEGSSAQTDLVTGFWVMCTAASVLHLLPRAPAQPVWSVVLRTGACVGLALFTKGTAYVFLAPFGLLFLVLLVHRLGWRRSLVPAVVAGCLALILNAGYFGRNLAFYGTPFGRSPLIDKLKNTECKPRLCCSNVIKNFALHLATPYPQVNQQVVQGVTDLHRWLGVDLNDERISWGKFFLSGCWNDESRATNPFHLALIGLGLAVLPGTVRSRGQGWLWAYAAAVCGAFLAFCLYLKWQVWHPRLHLPLFLLWAPFVGHVLAEKCLKTYGVVLATLLLLGLALPVAVWNAKRPLLPGTCTRFPNATIFTVPRDTQYFQNDLTLQPHYHAVAEWLDRQGVQEVGLFGMSDNYFEYPLLRLLNPGRQQRYALRYCDVEGYRWSAERRPSWGGQGPKVVVGMGGPKRVEFVTREGETYRRQATFGDLVVYVKQGT